MLHLQGAGAGSKKRSFRNDDGDGDDSAMSAYDPYGRHKNVYKGVRLHEDSNHKEQVLICKANSSFYQVAFVIQIF